MIGEQQDQLEQSESVPTPASNVLNGLADALGAEFPLVPSYSRYARLYDELGQEQFALYLMPLVTAVVQRHGLRLSSALDLPCGTGAASIFLARKGCRVVGVDGSVEMLAIARRKASDAGVDIHFEHQQMTQIRLPHRADLVLSLYDSVNYLLTSEELEEAFSGVAAVMNPGGLYIFDVNTVTCLEREWGNQVAEERGNGSALVHVYSYDGESGIGTLDLLGFQSTSRGIERFREVHRERGYRYLEVVAALERSGLGVVEAYSFPDLTPPSDDASRLIFVAARLDGTLAPGSEIVPKEMPNLNTGASSRGESGADAE